MSGYAAFQPGAVSAGAGAGAASTVCRYFATQGKCFYGDECKFEHAAEAASGGGGEAAWQSPSSSSSDGETQPASAAPSSYTVPASSAAAPVSKPLSSLAARAKEWTPSSAAASSTSSPPSAKPSSTTTSASSGALKLNPNKTPFKPSASTVDAAARPFVPGGGAGSGGSRLNNQVAAFVPLDEVTQNMASMHMQQQQGYDDDGGDDDDGNQQLNHNDQEDDDGQDQYELHEQHNSMHPQHFGGGGSLNPYAAPEPFGGAMMHHDEQLDDGQLLDGDDDQSNRHQQQHMLQPGSFVPPHTYTTYADFAASSMPVGGAHGRSLQSSDDGSSSDTPQYPTSYGPVRRAGTGAGAGGSGGGGGIFMDDGLRSRLTLASHLRCARLQPDDALFATLPTTLDHDRFHSLLPLASDEAPQELGASPSPSSSSSSWYATTTGGAIAYKVTSAVDGRSYVVKRSDRD